MKKLKVLLFIILIALIAVLGSVVYFLFFNNSISTGNDETQQTETETEAPIEITLVSVGDDLIHQPLLSEAQTGSGYNFDHFFAQVSEYVSSADVAVINQETMLAGSDIGYSGYPMFNSPDEVGEAIINAGFDVVLHASNHAADKGTAGISHAISYWKTKTDQITMLGLNENQDERDAIRVVDVEGIKIAMLNYTYSLNGLTLPSGSEYMVNIMDDNTKAQVLEDIQTASGMADFVIVFPHWGVEYTNSPNENQKTWAVEMTDAGADLIIGTHPHVVQPVEWIQTPSGNWSLCYYSLGNFISNQAWLQDYGSETAFNTQLGGMASVTLVKENGVVTIKQDATGVIPIVTHNSSASMTTTYFLRDYNDTLAASHICRNRFGSAFNMQWLNDKSESVFGSFIIQ